MAVILCHPMYAAAIQDGRDRVARLITPINELDLAIIHFCFNLLLMGHNIPIVLVEFSHSRA